jgi:hypothetical protein
MRRYAIALLFPLALFACKSSSGDFDASVHPDAQSCPIGDMSQPMQIEIVHRTLDGGLEMTQNAIPLIEPPQGGYVVFVGVRAKNLDGCPVTIQGAIRDVCDHSVVGLDMRMVSLEPTSDGWGEPKQPSTITNYANIPMCPATADIRNVQGEPYELMVTLQDKTGRMVKTSTVVTPFCADPAMLDTCNCQCAKQAILGATCPLHFDAGTTDCPPPDGGTHD